MFYSHTILARKGPLGTVWCAAHLQNRLTKAHYTSTNIRSTVERIMFPEVPIALRMSGHLLLGVVRIYSMQVEYLFKECNVVLFRLKEAKTTINVNLPENASHAPYHSITLPETFALDALELEDDLTQDGFYDKHKKSHDEITLTDQIPTGRDQYVAFTIDQDVLRASFTPFEDEPGSGVSAMEEDSDPSVPENIADDRQGPFIGDPTGVDNEATEDIDVETLRDASHNNNMGNLRLSDILEPDTYLEKQILDEKETRTPEKDTIAFPALSPQPRNKQEFPFASADQAQQNSDVDFLFEHHSVDLAMRSSPSIVQEHILQPEARPQRPRRRRRQHFDNHTVLSNSFMKRSLTETNDIKRVLKNGPSSSLAIWRSNKRLRREVIFDEPLLTGLSGDLGNCFQSEYISSRARLVILDEAHSEPVVGPDPESDIDPEIERLRDYEGPGNNFYGGILGSPNQFKPSASTHMPSSTNLDGFTPSTTNIVSGSLTGILPTPDRTGSTWSYATTDMRTPERSLRDRDYDRTALFDIPESSGELGFLEREGDSPGSLRTPQSGYLSTMKGAAQESDKLSARARAVALYLKKQSSTTPTSKRDGLGGPSEKDSHLISLNSILQGKTKKVSARMFFETLVLHNANYVKVQQEEAYGDILLEVTPKLVDDL